MTVVACPLPTKRLPSLLHCRVPLFPLVDFNSSSRRAVFKLYTPELVLFCIGFLPHNHLLIITFSLTQPSSFLPTPHTQTHTHTHTRTQWPCLESLLPLSEPPPRLPLPACCDRLPPADLSTTLLHEWTLTQLRALTCSPSLVSRTRLSLFLEVPVVLVWCKPKHFWRPVQLVSFVFFSLNRLVFLIQFNSIHLK